MHYNQPSYPVFQSSHVTLAANYNPRSLVDVCSPLDRGDDTELLGMIDNILEDPLPVDILPAGSMAAVLVVVLVVVLVIVLVALAAVVVGVSSGSGVCDVPVVVVVALVLVLVGMSPCGRIRDLLVAVLALVGVSPPCGVCDVLSLAGALPQGGNMVVGILVAWAVLLDWNSTLSEDDSGALSVDSVLAGSNVVAGYDTLAAAGG
jgi:hypothetical protein